MPWPSQLGTVLGSVSAQYAILTDASRIPGTPSDKHSASQIDFINYMATSTRTRPTSTNNFTTHPAPLIAGLGGLSISHLDVPLTFVFLTLLDLGIIGFVALCQPGRQ